MRAKDIRSAVCGFFNGLPEFSGCPFVQAPQASSAPVGTYVAVRVEAVEQDGSMLSPNGGGDYGFLSVATVSLTEVEGDGDHLRHALQRLQSPEFVRAARDAGFAVWDFSGMTAIDTLDGEFVVRQWRATFRTHFNEATASGIETMASAEVDFQQGG